MKIYQAEVDELGKHPYFSYAEAKVMIAYLKHHGVFQSPEDLKHIKIFKEEWVDKIAPYLDFK